MSAIEIVLAGPDDHDAVDELVTAAYAHDYGPREHNDDELRHSVVRSTRFDVWIARDDRTLLGSITTASDHGEKLLEDTRADELDFRLLAVSPAARRLGIGSTLTTHVITLARQRHLRGVFLKSAPQMTGAHRLYESLGFRRDRDRDGLIVGGVRQFDLYAFAIDIDPTHSDTTAVVHTAVVNTEEEK
ncbi:MAG: GNAT family N-acetyltransferase [Gordonia sp. (in: high G+C Gram-positive bacteria)]